MPASIHVDEQDRRERRQWWFEGSHKWGEDILTCALVDNWYRYKVEFEAQAPEHPVTWMRQALDAREWILKIMHGEAKLTPITVGGAKTQRTKEIQFAAILTAARYRLVTYEDRIFTYLDDGNIHQIDRQCREPFDAGNPLVHLPVIWRRESLFARDMLARLINDPRCVPQVTMWDRGRRILLSSKADRETKHRLFSA